MYVCWNFGRINNNNNNNNNNNIDCALSNERLPAHIIVFVFNKTVQGLQFTTMINAGISWLSMININLFKYVSPVYFASLTAISEKVFCSDRDIANDTNLSKYSILQ